eukprot:307744-Chlamydomonas_euryale.AAC.1
MVAVVWVHPHNSNHESHAAFRTLDTPCSECVEHNNNNNTMTSVNASQPLSSPDNQADYNNLDNGGGLSTKLSIWIAALIIRLIICVCKWVDLSCPGLQRISHNHTEQLRRSLLTVNMWMLPPCHQ